MEFNVYEDAECLAKRLPQQSPPMRKRRILWVVTGSEKTDMLRRPREGDASIPAGRVHRDRAVTGQLAAEQEQGG